MKFFIKDFFGKCDQTRREVRIWSRLLKKFLMESFIFYAESLLKIFFTSIYEFFFFSCII